MAMSMAMSQVAFRELELRMRNKRSRRKVIVHFKVAEQQQFQLISVKSGRTRAQWLVAGASASVISTKAFSELQ